MTLYGHDFVVKGEGMLKWSWRRPCEQLRRVLTVERSGSELWGLDHPSIYDLDLLPEPAGTHCRRYWHKRAI